MTHRARPTAPILATVVTAAVVAMLGAAGCGSTKTAGNTKTAASSSSAVALDETSLGPVLVDAKGRTLYLFEGDRRNVSTLSAAGRAIWPPYTSSARPAAMGAANATLIGAIPGSGQVTYNGHPLYYYVGDRQSGQTKGQGLNQFGARWYVLSATGSPVTSHASSTFNPSTLGY